MLNSTNAFPGFLGTIEYKWLFTSEDTFNLSWAESRFDYLLQKKN